MTFFLINYRIDYRLILRNNGIKDLPIYSFCMFCATLNGTIVLAIVFVVLIMFIGPTCPPIYLSFVGCATGVLSGKNQPNTKAFLHSLDRIAKSSCIHDIMESNWYIGHIFYAAGTMGNSKKASVISTLSRRCRSETFASLLLVNVCILVIAKQLRYFLQTSK